MFIEIKNTLFAEQLLIGFGSQNPHVSPKTRDMGHPLWIGSETIHLVGFRGTGYQRSLPLYQGAEYNFSTATRLP
jgi:hypothetical protein